MTRLFLQLKRAVACMSFLCTILSAHAEAQNSVASEFQPGELIVGYRSAEQRDEAIGLLKGKASSFQLMNGESAEQVDLQKHGSSEIRLKVTLPPGVQALAASDKNAERKILEELSSKIRADDPNVEYAHPNWILKLEPLEFKPTSIKRFKLPVSAPPGRKSPNDTIYQNDLHWHYGPAPAGMNAIGAWALNKGSSSIVVAVIDTGIVSKHPDIVGSKNLLKGFTLATKGRLAGAEDDLDCNGYHGTHVAGTVGIGATDNGKLMSGVNWTVSVLPIRVFDQCGGARTSDITDAIRWAAGLMIEGAPVNKTPAQIINLSLGSNRACTLDQDGAMRTAIEAVIKAGTVVVVAAGNSAVDVSNFTPASCPGVISVAAHDASGKLTFYSNYGDVSIMAPGGDTRQLDKNNLPLGVWSIVKANSESFNLSAFPYQGTSMAAPHVSGAIALAMANNAALKGQPMLVADAVKASAIKLQDGACTKPCGPGQLDAAVLMQIKTPPSERDGEGVPPTPRLPNEQAKKPILDGSWLAAATDAKFEIEGSEWRHPKFGIGRVTYTTEVSELSTPGLKVAYQNREISCDYGVALIDGGAVLVLETRDATSDGDACPTGRFARIGKSAPQ